MNLESVTITGLMHQKQMTVNFDDFMDTYIATTERFTHANFLLDDTVYFQMKISDIIYQKDEKYIEFFIPINHRYKDHTKETQYTQKVTFPTSLHSKVKVTESELYKCLEDAWVEDELVNGAPTTKLVYKQIFEDAFAETSFLMNYLMDRKVGFYDIS